MALLSLRKASRSPIFAVLLIIIAASFVLWGPGDVFRSNTGRAVATVGGKEIGIRDFQQEYERRISMMAEESGQRLTPDQARATGVTDQILNGMISRTAVTVHAENLGITASDRLVQKQIVDVEAFKGVGQRFDEQVYVRVLNQSGLNRLDFERTMRMDAAREQLAGALIDGFKTPRGMAELIYQYQAEQRRVSYLTLSPDLVGLIETPSQETLLDFYQANIVLFTAPEYRTATYLTLAPTDFADSVVVSDEDIKALYDRRISLYSTPESRGIERLFFDSEASAHAALERTQAGESFITVGQSFGLNPEDVVLGLVTEREMSDPTVAAAAFANDNPGIVGPIEGDLSWAIVNVVSIVPESIQELDSVSNELRSEIVLDEAQEVLFDQLLVVEEEIASGTPIEEIATKVGLKAKIIANIDANANGLDGRKIRSIPSDTRFLDEVFASAKGFESDLIELADNFNFVVRVDEISEKAERPLEAVQEEVLTEWRKQERRNRLDVLAQGITDRAKAGEEFRALGNEIGRGVLVAATPLNRIQTSDTFSPDVISRVFTVDEGDFVYGRVGIGSSLVIAQVNEVIAGDPAQASDIIDEFQGQLAETMRSDLTDVYLRGLLSEFGTQRNNDAVDLATGAVSPNT